MKFTISSALLSSRLQTLGRVIVAKNTLNILDCFLFEINGQTLTITASDNENRLAAQIPLTESDSNIRFAAKAKTVQDAIKEIPEQPLDFYVNEQTFEIVVEYCNGNYNFMAQTADDYPVVQPLDETSKHTIVLSSDFLYDATNRALFATAEDTLRPVMNGIFFDAKDDQISVVATDGHKLAYSKQKQAQNVEKASFIFPRKPATLLKNIIGKEKVGVSVQFDNRNALITTSGFELWCRLIEGAYPEYERVIPHDNANIVIINRDALIAALRRTLIFSNQVSSLVRLRLESSKLTISTQDTDFSQSAKESLLCDYSGMPLTIGFKGAFLLELLNNLQSEEVEFRLSDASRAGLILPATQTENCEVVMLLMPMMVND